MTTIDDAVQPAGVPARPVILVGVQRGLPDAVLREAAALARDLNADLVCAHVDLDRYALAARRGQSAPRVPVGPDLPDDFDPVLAEHIDAGLAGTGVSWTGRELVGDAVRALTGLARSVHAFMIVVGARGADARASLQEFLQGSVALHLAHRQRTPVLIVPLSPVADGQPLPWERPLGSRP